MTLSELHTAKLQQPVFIRALAVEKRLIDALSEATFHRARLINLRKQLRWEIDQANAQDMEIWLAMFSQAIDHAIDTAFYGHEALPAESPVVWGMVA